jgi:CRISPR-associated protein Cas2
MALVWVIYDIADDRRRAKVSNVCLNNGLYRVQKSVFLGKLGQNGRDTLALQCQDLIDLQCDSVYIFPMDAQSFAAVRLLGQAFDEKLVTDDVRALFV